MSLILIYGGPTVSLNRGLPSLWESFKRIIQVLYRVYVCLRVYLSRCSMYKKTGREEKKLGKFFQKKKRNNSYLISYVTDSFEFFKRYEKFSAEPRMKLKEGWKKKKEEEEEERKRQNFFFSPLYTSGKLLIGYRKLGRN